MSNDYALLVYYIYIPDQISNPHLSQTWLHQFHTVFNNIFKQN